MIDENTHILNLIGIQNKNLEKENLRLKKELEAAKKIIFRMDRRREGFIRMVDHLRENWTPEDKNNEKEQGIKKDSKKFNDALIESIANVNKDEKFCKEREILINREIEKEATEEVRKEEELEQKLIADKWKRKNG